MTDRPTLHQAAILVGGRGTRLGELTNAMPKPLLPCGDRPFLAWILGELTRFGIDDVLLLTGYLADAFEAALPAIRRTLPRPLRIACVREPEPAGTGGALVNARGRQPVSQTKGRRAVCRKNRVALGTGAEREADRGCHPRSHSRAALRDLSGRHDSRGKYQVHSHEPAPDYRCRVCCGIRSRPGGSGDGNSGAGSPRCARS